MADIEKTAEALRKMGYGKKRMPAGVDDFKDLINGGYCFIDKTRFIKELLDNLGKVTIITRPRRFGKTLILSMLRYFFMLDKAQDNRQLFAGLDIERAGASYMEQQGSRPVVSLTLKGVQGADFAALTESLRELLRNLYGSFRFLQEADTASG